ncbi:MAG: hypothetical protein AAF699_07940 [Pseudomonadota bacterium]
MTSEAKSQAVSMLWWRSLCILALLNICLWTAIWIFTPAPNLYTSLQIGLSGVYVFVCAYRSIFPRVDLERFVVVDSAASSIFWGRSAATIAEICFGIQLGLLVYQLGLHAGLPWVQHAAWGITLFTIIAQVFCWHSILTLNHITQAVEELLWAAGLSWMAALLMIVAMNSEGILQTLAGAGILVSLVFVAYVLILDVPMYVKRFRHSRGAGHKVLSITEGIQDARDRREHKLDWKHWQDDALWLTPYFSIGVWISMGMIFVPFLI